MDFKDLAIELFSWFFWLTAVLCSQANHSAWAHAQTDPFAISATTSQNR